MPKKSGIKSVFFIYILFIVLLFVALVAVAIYITHITTIIRPDGEVSPSNWQLQYTRSFERYITHDDGNIQVSDEGIISLDQNELWLQILDKNGNETFSHSKPTGIQNEYSYSDIIEITGSNHLNGYTVFMMPMTNVEQDYTFIIGSSIGVSNVELFFNSDRYAGGKAVFIAVIVGLFILIIIVGLLYGIWLTRHLSRIVKSSNMIAARSYSPIKGKGAFGDAYDSLNKLDMEIRNSDKAKEETDRVRSEWIENITHDLKTPLSPIKGYAELLAEDTAENPENVQEYGSIILKNVNHTEKLINDLKLTYQLDFGTIPFNPQEVRFTRYLKELVIDIVNDPVFSDREIEFESNVPEFTVLLDPDLFRRAIQNLVINALVHNPPDTVVKVKVNQSSEDGVCILVSDNGSGMSEAELSGLFNRYYRGTNTEQRSEGSGLGLAIAKQIITLHKGTITVKSTVNEGTEFTILLPLED